MQYIAIDTETFLISDEEPIPRLVCMSFYYKSPRNETYFNDVVKEEKSILNYLTTWLNDEKITLLAHNASFDFTVFCRAFPDLLELINKKYKAGLIICTRLQEQLLQLKNGDYGLPSSLAFCVEKYLGLDINASKGEDSWRMNYWTLADVPLTGWAKDAIDYAKADAKYCYEVFIKQNSNIEDVKKQGYCDFLCTIMTKLQGLQIDQEFLKERLDFFNAKIHAQDAVLVECGFKSPKSKKNPTLKRNMDVIKGVLTELSQKHEIELKLTDKGGVSTDKESLGAFEGRHKGIDALIEIGSSATSVNTFLEPWSQMKILHPSLDILKSTGRMSCVKPNLQNVPRDGRVRGCIVPSPGNILCSIDYSQLELCALAQVTKEFLPDQIPYMLNAINEGKDLHLVTASNIMGISYLETERRYKSGDKEVKRIRQMAKAPNFGLSGGLGLETFIEFARVSYGVHMDKETGKKVIAAFFNSFPEVKIYLERIPSLLNTRENGVFYECPQLFTDRVRLIPESGYCAACNTFFQGLAADGVKEALIELCNLCWFGELEGEATPLLPIHDEFLFEIVTTARSVDDICSLLANTMINSMKKFLPDVKIIKAEPALMYRWEKEATACYDAYGRIYPWKYTEEVVNV